MPSIPTRYDDRPPTVAASRAERPYQEVAIARHQGPGGRRRAAPPPPPRTASPRKTRGTAGGWTSAALPRLRGYRRGAGHTEINGEEFAARRARRERFHSLTNLAALRTFSSWSAKSFTRSQSESSGRNFRSRAL